MHLHILHLTPADFICKIPPQFTHCNIRTSAFYHWPYSSCTDRHSDSTASSNLFCYRQLADRNVHCAGSATYQIFFDNYIPRAHAADVIV